MMKRALTIAIIIHCSLLLAAGYIYVMRPEKKEEVFRAFLRAEKVAPLKKIKTAPPKKEMKKTPAVRPIRRERPIELIAVKKAVTSTFTVKLLEVSGAVYSPQVALVSVPEPTLAPERLPSFWEREIELKGRAIQLESFGVTTLKPLGSPENPITRIIFQIITNSAFGGHIYKISLVYPEHRLLATVIGAGGQAPEGSFQQTPVFLGPFAVPPQEFVFSVEGWDGFTNIMRYSNDPLWCKTRNTGPNIIYYAFEDWGDWDDGDAGDIGFLVTFMGAEDW